MSTPQQPEMHRSRETVEMDLDNVAGNFEGADRPGAGGRGPAPVPSANQPGHHPDVEQDKPDLDAFAARLGVDAEASEIRRRVDGPLGEVLAQLRHRLPDVDGDRVAARLDELRERADLDRRLARGRGLGREALVATAGGMRALAIRLEGVAARLAPEDDPEDGQT